jgi:hypothetical protein
MPQSTHGQECSRAPLTLGMNVYCSTQSEGRAQSTHGQECSRAPLTQGMRVYSIAQGYASKYAWAGVLTRAVDAGNALYSIACKGMPQSTHGQECSRAPLTPLRIAFTHFFAQVFNKSLLKLRKDSHDSRLALPHRCHCACSCNAALMHFDTRAYSRY